MEATAEKPTLYRNSADLEWKLFRAQHKVWWFIGWIVFFIVMTCVSGSFAFMYSDQKSVYLTMLFVVFFIVLCDIISRALNQDKERERLVDKLKKKYDLSKVEDMIFSAPKALKPGFEPEDPDIKGMVKPLFGIWCLIVTALGFTAMNVVGTSEPAVAAQRERAANIKTIPPAILLSSGAGAIVFGFLDNFGMKLGTDALEERLFYRMGRWGIKGDKSFRPQLCEYLNYKEWVDTKKNEYNGDLFQEYVNEFCEKNPLVNQSRISNEGEFKKCIAVSEGIEGAANMLGNTFSDFIGAVLGSGVNALFMHATGASGAKLSDFPKANRAILNPVSQVFLEAFFIAWGCLIPVFKNYSDAQIEVDSGRKYSNFFGGSSLSYLVLAPKDVRVKENLAKISGKGYRFSTLYYFCWLIVLGFVVSCLFNESRDPSAGDATTEGPGTFWNGWAFFVLAVLLLLIMIVAGAIKRTEDATIDACKENELVQPTHPSDVRDEAIQYNGETDQEERIDKYIEKNGLTVEQVKELRKLQHGKNYDAVSANSVLWRVAAAQPGEISEGDSQTIRGLRLPSPAPLPPPAAVAAPNILGPEQSRQQVRA